MKEWMKECLQKPQDHFSWPLMYRDRHGLTAQEVAGIIGHEQKTKNLHVDGRRFNLHNSAFYKTSWIPRVYLAQRTLFYSFHRNYGLNNNLHVKTKLIPFLFNINPSAAESELEFLK
ncbi:hypothetical protein LCGC14_2443680 [marine sediment metagenome]|uniref:Uncharacterized protein n=1 Tax=marine sediment metagenome TaxID=412755 RepID=A0A0F9C5N4_9ZZZZ